MERSNTFGIDLDSKSIQDLPLQGSGRKRNIYSLLAVVPPNRGGFPEYVLGGMGYSIRTARGRSLGGVQSRYPMRLANAYFA